MKLGVRLGLGFGAVILLLIISTFMGYTAIKNSSHGLDKVTNDRFPKTVLANQIISAVNVNARAIRNSLLVKNPEDMRAELDRIPEQRKITAENFDKLDKSIKSEKGRALLANNR